MDRIILWIVYLSVKQADPLCRERVEISNTNWNYFRKKEEVLNSSVCMFFKIKIYGTLNLY